MSEFMHAVIVRATAAPLKSGHAPSGICAMEEPKHRKLLPLFILGAMLCSLPCFCQNASVSGSVNDSTGAAIQRATVAYTNSNTSAVYQAATDDDGVYRVSGLVPGIYSATVTKPGFKSIVKPNIEVHVQDAISIAFTLPAGAVSETVTVEGGAPLLVTESTSLGQVIGGQQVQETPLNGRNVMNLIALVPGVIPQGGTQGSATGNQAAAGDFTNAFGWGNYQIGGGIAGQSQILYDGATLNSSYGNTSNIVPTQDTIQEFRVSTNTLSPEFGATAGGVVELSSKSGTSVFHGSAYEYLRNTLLDANNYFNNAGGIPRSKLVQNQFGGTIGGPIVRNKAFFFFSYEGYRRRNGVPFEALVPTPAQLSGNFTANSPIYDPLTKHQFQCNGVLNVICPDRIDPTANEMANVLHYWPTPNANLGGGAINYVVNAAAGADSSQYNGRIDYAVSEKQKIFARYTYYNINTFPTTYILENTQGPRSLPRGLDVAHQVVIGDTYTINPTTVADVRLAYLRAYTPVTPPLNNVDLSEFGPFWANIQSSLTYRQLPIPYILSTASAPYVAADLSNNGLSNNYTIGASIVKVIGKHSLKAGIDLRRYDFRFSQISAAAGLFVFAGLFTGGPLTPAGSGATPIADFDLGLITPAPGTSAFQTVKNTYSIDYYQSYYLNDTYQVNQRLTLNYGVRWELPGSYKERHDLNTVLLPQLQNPLVLVASPQYPSDHDLEPHDHLFAPRIGLSYQALRTTVVRAGYGINFLPQWTTSAAPYSSPINAAITNVPFGGTLSNPLLGKPLLQPIGRTPGGLTQFQGQSIASRIPNQTYSYVQQWNLDIQQALGQRASLEFSYGGARGEHLPLPRLDINQLPDSSFSLGSALLVPNAQRVLAGQLLRPYPEYQQVNATGSFSGDSYYNSFLATFQQRFSFGGTVLADYTWSKFMSNTEAYTSFLESNTVGALQDNTNLAAERSLLTFDVPHRAIFSYVMELPFGHGKHFLANTSGAAGKLVSGWSVAGITTFASGFPLAITSAAPNDLAIYFGAGTIRPNVLPGCNKSISGVHPGSGLPVINAACFTAPGLFSFGNESRVDSSLRAQGINNWDFSASKLTHLTEKVSLDFRGEFFNIFNRVQFGEPNTSAGGAFFGVVTSQYNLPRQIQLSLRVAF